MHFCSSVALIILAVSHSLHGVKELPEDHCTFMQIHHSVRSRAHEAFEACSEVVPVKGSLKPMPAMTFGTSREGILRDSEIGQTLTNATKAFLTLGGRNIDTAIRYSNHEYVAAAIRESGVPREEIWITDKIQPAQVNTSSDVVKAVENSLKELDVDYIDLMLLHWPHGEVGGGGYNVELWRGLLEAKKAGYILNAGVSNYNVSDLEELEHETGELPVVNEMEFHPFSPNSTLEIVNWCQEQGIAIMAFDLTGGPILQGDIQSDAVSALAEKYQVSDVQVLLRWGLDKGVAPIFTSDTPEHIKEDLNCSGLKHLSESDMQMLESSEKPDFWFTYHHPDYGHDYESGTVTVGP